MNDKPASSRSVLRRIVILVGVLVGIVVYAIGWQVTDISLEETQDPTRQEVMQRALRELFAPDIFAQERESIVTSANIMLGCQEGQTVEQPERTEHYVIITPDCGQRGDVISVEGFGFEPDSDVFLRWVPPTGQKRPLVRADIDGEGHFLTQIEVPGIRGDAGQTHQIEAEGSWPVGLPRLSQTTLLVLEKIVETIFLALMATTIAVPIAVLLSFFSARNLMRQIRTPLGTALIGFVLVPVGGWLGSLLLMPVVQLGLTWGKGLALGLIGAVAGIAAYGLVARYANGLDLPTGHFQFHLRRVGMNLLLLVVFVFVFGAVAGICVWLGEQLQEGILGYLGNFLGTLGLLLELVAGAVAWLAGALLAATIGMEFSRDWLRHLAEPASSVLGAVLGALGGALLLALMAAIANQAALLGILPPFIAATLAMQMVGMIYKRWVSRGRPQAGRAHATARLILSWVAAVIVFALTYAFLDTGRSLIDGRLPAATVWDLGLVSIQTFTAKAMLIGAVLGGLGGFLAGTQSSFPLGMALYNTSRTILNALRAVEPLIMGIVFVIWVGIGPFAGVLALTLHSIAALGKLYSEQTENIDPGPLEAIQATGATWLQTVVYAVIPQIVPPYIAFTMYRWDINVRMSTIIGFVGGGGIGFLLQQQINLLRYKDAGVAVLAIAIVVSILDYASASIRERIV